MRQCGIRVRETSLFSVAEEKRRFHHAAEERNTITQSRGQGEPERKKETSMGAKDGKADT